MGPLAASSLGEPAKPREKRVVVVCCRRARGQGHKRKQPGARRFGLRFPSRAQGFGGIGGLSPSLGFSPSFGLSLLSTTRFEARYSHSCPSNFTSSSRRS